MKQMKTMKIKIRTLNLFNQTLLLTFWFQKLRRSMKF